MPHNIVNFGLLAAEIVSGVWGTPANFNGFRVLAALLHGTLVMMMMMMMMKIQVECSLQSGFVKGMLVLVANRSPPGSYWPASIVMPCFQLLRLRPIGCDDAARDFWCDVTSADVRPISACRDRQQDVCPPDGIFMFINTTRAVQPVATCRQSPYLDEPAMVIVT